VACRRDGAPGGGERWSRAEDPTRRSITRKHSARSAPTPPAPRSCTDGQGARSRGLSGYKCLQVVFTWSPQVVAIQVPVSSNQHQAAAAASVGAGARRRRSHPMGREGPRRGPPPMLWVKKFYAVEVSDPRLWECPCDCLDRAARAFAWRVDTRKRRTGPTAVRSTLDAILILAGSSRRMSTSSIAAPSLGAAAADARRPAYRRLRVADRNPASEREETRGPQRAPQAWRMDRFSPEDRARDARETRQQIR
jgi:hypothetical protein